MIPDLSAVQHVLKVDRQVDLDEAEVAVEPPPGSPILRLLDGWPVNGSDTWFQVERDLKVFPFLLRVLALNPMHSCRISVVRKPTVTLRVRSS